MTTTTSTTSTTAAARPGASTDAPEQATSTTTTTTTTTMDTEQPSVLSSAATADAAAARRRTRESHTTASTTPTASSAEPMSTTTTTSSSVEPGPGSTEDTLAADAQAMTLGEAETTMDPTTTSRSWTTMTAANTHVILAAASKWPPDWDTIVAALQVAPKHVTALVLPEEHAHAGRGLLHLAVLDDKPEYAALLIARGTNPCLHDSHGETPLHVAARQGRERIVLAIMHADPSAITRLDVDRWTPLHSAAELGHDDVAQLLMRAGSNVNARCRQGGTPLFLAAMEGNDTMVDLLLHAGARNFKAYRRDTPADAAEKNGHLDLASRLRTYFASTSDYFAQPDLSEPHEPTENEGEEAEEDDEDEDGEDADE